MTTRSRRAPHPTPARSYHHGNLRQALIDATLAIVEESGPDAVNIREAARRAGVSPGAPFRHFADKAELMTALAEEGVRRLREATERAVAAAGDDPLDRFRAIGVTYVTFAAAHPAHFRVMNVPEYASSECSAAIRDDQARGQAEIHSLIASAQQSGLINAGPTDAVLLAAATMTYGAARMFVDGHFALMGIGPDRAEWVAQTVTGLLGVGIATEPARTGKKPAKKPAAPAQRARPRAKRRARA